jgi:hypothetical protein
MNTAIEAVNINDVNKSAILSTVASELFQANLNPRIALITATAYVGALEYMDDEDMFIEAFVDGLEITELTVKGTEVPDDEMNIEEILEALIQASYITLTVDPSEGVLHTVGPRITELLELRTEAYAPALAMDGVERRFGYAPTKYSALFKEAIHALEDTKYTVDDNMMSIALRVLAKSGKDDEEGYVLRGREKLDSNDAYNSEFKGDSRGRMYQAACHGPNGQASDRSRALMDLYGVKMNYDAKNALELLKHEMSDMVSIKDKGERGKLVHEAHAHPVDFIIKHEDGELGVKKPWSFVKAAQTLVELHNHINHGAVKPYIGMAFGKDAKCSGPQLGALMVGDGDLAAACGFSLTQIEDAYHRCITYCEAAGFHGLTRDLIKKPFMGIFYGQGWMAFMNPDDLVDNMGKKAGKALWVAIHGEEILGNEKRAKEFHKAVTASFGAKMISVRNAMRSYNKKIAGKVSHLLPDGFKVAMNYKLKVNILGEAVTFDTPKYDAFLRNNVESYKFINLQMNTKHVDTSDFVRNGFVNMVQGVDGLIARLIVVHLKRMGCEHIIAVHDCFRVSVHDMGLLDQAIKNAYRDLFGSLKNEATEDLPEGTDILGLYFDGINAQLLPEHFDDAIDISQFFSSGSRRLQKVRGEKLNHLISALGQTYYFDK